jgi:hypothetical protein
VDIGFANTTALHVYFLFACSSLSELARMHVQSPGVPELSNAVKEFLGARFMRRCRSSLLRKYGDSLNYDKFVLAIDDTALADMARINMAAENGLQSTRAIMGRGCLYSP